MCKCFGPPAAGIPAFVYVYLCHHPPCFPDQISARLRQLNVQPQNIGGISSP